MPDHEPGIPAQGCLPAVGTLITIDTDRGAINEYAV